MSVQPSLPSWKVEVYFVAPQFRIVVKGFLGAFETKSSLSVCCCICLGSERFSESHARLVVSIGLTWKMKQRTSTASRAFASLGSSFAEIFRQIVSNRVNTLSNTNLVAFEA